MNDNEKANLILQILCVSNKTGMETDHIANATNLPLLEINRIVKLLEDNGDIKTYNDKDVSTRGAIGILKISATKAAYDSKKYLVVLNPKFNIYIKTDLFIYNILEISDDNLNTIVEAYLFGSDSFTISGEKYWISDLLSIKIFKAEIDINDHITRINGTKLGLWEFDLARKRWMSIEFLKLFGADITNSILGDSEYGSKNKRASSNNKIEFINQGRLEELKGVKSPNFDLTRLIRLCEELNDNFLRENYLAVSMISRSIINHVPPIFGKDNFEQVCSNISGKNSSFKKNMQKLYEMKNIADRNLHQQIRASETLPNSTQVNFTQEFDVLLEEIVRLLK